MAETIQAMRERRNALVKETRNLLDNNPGATWNDDHQKQYDEKMAEVERIDAAIARHQKQLDAEADEAFKAMGGRETDAEPGKPKDKLNALYARWLARGDKGLSAEDWQTVQAAMSADPDTSPENGGYTVPKETARTILETLKAYGGMREVATIITTSGGNPLSFPTTDGTAEEGELVPENTAATDEDIEFGITTLKGFKFSSKVVTVPFELLQDSAIDVEALVNGRLSQRLGRITNRLYTTGTGSGQPMGIVTASATGKTGAVSATPVITYEDLVDLEHSVDPAYRTNAGYMFHDQVLAMVRKIKDNDGRPIFVPSLADGSVGGAPARLMNRNITINQHMATPAAGAKTVLFGDFKKYTIRDIMNVTLFRFTDSAYTKKGQVGFLAWMRSDGNLLDVGGAVKHFRHGAAA
ncbi:phage major capsid protein [Pigmentiphaga daeguensis]|uniref:Phage major capsid protein n=1 Tax=Pigmentiphaga daeguensis TaxID=414049 RepID=A0ABN1BAI3_9BURK